MLTNMAGEHALLEPREFELLMDGELGLESPTVRRLRGKHLVRAVGEELPVELLALKVRTRYWRLPEFTALHMFVVSLRCEHSCPYCQVSRQSADKSLYDMTEETAMRALEMTFRSPSPHLKIEFQGGEPLLNFALIEFVVDRAKEHEPRRATQLDVRDRDESGAAR